MHLLCTHSKLIGNAEAPAGTMDAILTQSHLDIRTQHRYIYIYEKKMYDKF